MGADALDARGQGISNDDIDHVDGIMRSPHVKK